MAQADDDSGAPVADAGSSAGQCSALPSLAPTAVTTYADLITTITTGGHARVTIDYSKCQLDGQPGPAAIGGTSFDTFEQFSQGLIGNAQPLVGTSQAQLIKFGTSYVYDYVRINVSADNTVDVLVNYLDPTTFAVTVDEDLSCVIDDGTNGGGVSIFKSAI